MIFVEKKDIVEKNILFLKKDIVLLLRTFFPLVALRHTHGITFSNIETKNIRKKLSTAFSS